MSVSVHTERRCCILKALRVGLESNDEPACKIQLEIEHKWDGNVTTSDQLLCSLASIQMVCVIQPSLSCLRQSLKYGKILEMNGRQSQVFTNNNKKKKSSISIFPKQLLCCSTCVALDWGVMYLEAYLHTTTVWGGFFNIFLFSLVIITFKWHLFFICLGFFPCSVQVCLECNLFMQGFLASCHDAAEETFVVSRFGSVTSWEL